MTIKDKDKEIQSTGKWITIPGFSRYRINPETREIQSSNLSRGKEWRTMKVKRNGMVGIKSDKNESYGSYPKRLLYCALHGINPLRMNSRLFVTEAADGTLHICDISGFNQFRLKEKPVRTDSSIKEDYRRAKRIIDLILQAYETEDYSQVVSEIWQYEKQIKHFLRLRGLAYNEEKIEEIWMQIFDVIIDAIKKRKAYIVNVLGYLKRIAVTLVTNERKMRKRMMSIETLTSTPEAMRVKPNVI